MQTRYGALPEEWDQLSLALGLTSDLLPVVSNPKAAISPDSAMKSVGKTPSRYNGRRQAVGFAGWTQYTATNKDITTWRKQPDYGICIQTREVRAIDIDVEDARTADAIASAIYTQTGISLPKRTRPNSAKCLFVFSLPGDLPKRVIRLEQGIIELLASGQQFVACGTHPSGARYGWDHGLPDTIPELTLEQVDALWEHLAHTFGTSATVSTSPSKAKVLDSAIANDPTATYLLDHEWVKSTERDGRLHITCPFEHEHTTESAVSATTYFPANTGGYQHGHFDCRHAHCEHRTDDEFKAQIGIPVSDPFDDFDIIPGSGTENALKSEANTKSKRFAVTPLAEFVSQQQRTRWIVKGVLPQAELGVIYGESASGKTFFINDVLCAIALGQPWRGHRVNQGNAVYICAEGASGMRDRMRAFADNSGVALADIGIGVIADAPNFMQVADVKAVIEAVKAFGPVSVIVVDTFAQVMPGGNENAGEDVGKALAHCKALHKHTGALVLLIHHSGKDASKGARGWSGLRAACDVEIEVTRCEDDRVATITKLKDGVDGAEFGFRLKTVPVGMDEDDEVITSCVIEYTEGVKVARGGTKEKAQGRNEKLALQCLHDLLGAGDTQVSSYELIKAITAQMVPPEEGKRDRRGDIARQAVESLREKGSITVANGFVGLPQGEKE